MVNHVIAGGAPGFLPIEDSPPTPEPRHGHLSRHSLRQMIEGDEPIVRRMTVGIESVMRSEARDEKQVRASNASMLNHRWHLCTDLWVRQHLRQEESQRPVVTTRSLLTIVQEKDRAFSVQNLL